MAMISCLRRTLPLVTFSQRSDPPWASLAVPLHRNRRQLNIRQPATGNWQLTTDLSKSEFHPALGRVTDTLALTLIRSGPSSKVRAELRIVKITKVQVR